MTNEIFENGIVISTMAFQMKVGSDAYRPDKHSNIFNSSIMGNPGLHIFIEKGGSCTFCILYSVPTDKGGATGFYSYDSNLAMVSVNFIPA